MTNMGFGDKKLWIQSAVLCAGIFFFFGVRLVSAAEERIWRFDVDIRINQDASVEFTEKIDYDFGDSEKHGISRNIPLKYEARGGNYNLRMRNVSVADEKGVPYNFQVSWDGGDKVIRIGDEDRTITGRHIYVIRYKIERSINYFSDHDELYWNATGNDWKVPILEAGVNVFFPVEIEKEEAAIRCFSGYSSSKEPCEARGPMEEEGKVLGAVFEDGDMLAGEGLTVVAGLPKGILYEPSVFESSLRTLEDNLILFMPLLVFAILFLFWRRRGRDPRGRGTIIAEFDAPKGMMPAEIGTIIDENCGEKEIAAEIINLAVKGYIRIERKEKKAMFAKSSDYVFFKLKDGADLENDYEKNLFDGIFKDKDKEESRLSELKNSFYEDYKKVQGKVYEAVADKGYFILNPQNERIKYSAIFLLGAVTAFFLVVSAFDIPFEIYSLASLGISCIIAASFAFVMPRRTSEGVAMREHILGLKRYLSVAEKDRLEFLNAPEKNPERFEKLLPYAIALGVEKEWAKQFQDIYKTNPSWYSDPQAAGVFNSIYFVNSLGSFRSNFSSAAMASPAASGSSGLSGGGGFSGGGFGGGGGGSW